MNANGTGSKEVKATVSVLAWSHTQVRVLVILTALQLFIALVTNIFSLFVLSKSFV